MSGTASLSRRVVIIGGGIAGLSAAARLAQAGLPVTLLEASQLGGAASTRNQGWLHSGGIYALESLEYARLCHEALKQTLAFCPECVEPSVPPMVYFVSRPDTQAKTWVDAWAAAGIPVRELPLDDALAELPGFDRMHVQHAFELPDRAIRLDVLLTHLAACAENAGAEIRTETPARAVRRREGQIEAVITSSGEELAAGFVILAGGSSGHGLLAEFHRQRAGRQCDTELVTLKTHLVALRPEFGRRPFCVVDAAGFNHVPHPPSSVFGFNSWKRAASLDDDRTEAEAVTNLTHAVQRFFPAAPLEGSAVHAWSGTIIQAMRIDQIEPGHALWPAVVDHSRQEPAVHNLFSIFTGRASLWPILAEETRVAVLNRLNFAPHTASPPPWRLG